MTATASLACPRCLLQAAPEPGPGDQLLCRACKRFLRLAPQREPDPGALGDEGVTLYEIVALPGRRGQEPKRHEVKLVVIDSLLKRLQAAAEQDDLALGFFLRKLLVDGLRAREFQGEIDETNDT
jgi:hypothetical protein